MAKIFFISPSLQENAQNHSPDNTYSLGQAYLHAVIERDGYTIRTRNFNNVNEHSALQSFLSELKEFQPDYLLVQLFTMNRVAGYRLIRLAKKLFPHLKIILGGIHSSILYAQLLRNFPIDFVVIGEGEITIIELLAAIEAGGDVSTIPGIAYRDGSEVVKTPDRDLIKSLDTLPFPRHDLFLTPSSRVACVLTSRGCPFKCSFCCLHTVSRRLYRTRSVQNMIEEIELLLKNFPQIQIIQIVDDTFTINEQRAIQFCEEIIRRGIKTNFQCSGRLKPANAKLFSLMAKAGFSAIGFGLETGSPKLLKSIHKNLTQEDAIDAFMALKDINMQVAAFLMVGFPGETRETVNETIQFVSRLQAIKPFALSGSALLLVYPNTEVYEHMQEKGAITDDFWLSDKDVPFFTVEHSFHELRWMSKLINHSDSVLKQWLYFYGFYFREFFLFLQRKLTEFRVKKLITSTLSEITSSGNIHSPTQKK